MPLNRALIGKVYEPATLTVERDRVTSFADAIGEEDPVYRDPEAARAAGFPEQLAPPTFGTVMEIATIVQVVSDPELGVDYTRIVHGAQEYEWTRPIRVGDVLTAVPRILDIRALGPNEILEVEADIADASGRTVMVARGSMLSRGTAEARS